MKIVYFENFLLFVNALLEIRNYFQQIRYICITTVLLKSNRPPLKRLKINNEKKNLIPHILRCSFIKKKNKRKIESGTFFNFVHLGRTKTAF